MDNVFKNFGKDITSKRDTEFARYLREEILDSISRDILYDIAQETNVYVFSGVIRDYFLGRKSNHRDIDLVIEKNIDWRDIYRRYRQHLKVKVNSYGGIKAQIGTLSIDLWTMQRTWGIIHKGVRNTPQNLIRTAFFNFSAIAYRIDTERFYIHKSFAEFINKQQIDILYKENPNVPLCIVNAMYYSQVLQMPISPALKEWIVSRYSMFDNYEAPQLSHWGAVRYNHKEIHRFVSQCELK